MDCGAYEKRFPFSLPSSLPPRLHHPKSSRAGDTEARRAPAQSESCQVSKWKEEPTAKTILPVYQNNNNSLHFLFSVESARATSSRHQKFEDFPLKMRKKNSLNFSWMWWLNLASGQGGLRWCINPTGRAGLALMGSHDTPELENQPLPQGIDFLKKIFVTLWNADSSELDSVYL